MTPVPARVGGARAWTIGEIATRPTRNRSAPIRTGAPPTRPMSRPYRTVRLAGPRQSHAGHRTATAIPDLD